MCRDYSSLSCCKTGHDADIASIFSNVVDLGPECPYKKNTDFPALHQAIHSLMAELTELKWFCLACSPDQPKFVYNVSNILVCKDFVDKLWGGNRMRIPNLNILQMAPCMMAVDSETSDRTKLWYHRLSIALPPLF